MKKLKLSLIAVLAALPLLAVGTTVMFEKLGCIGSGLGDVPDIPPCIVIGINFDLLYRAAENGAFWSFIFAPISLIWIIVGSYVFFRVKRTIQ